MRPNTVACASRPLKRARVAVSLICLRVDNNGVGRAVSRSSLELP